MKINLKETSTEKLRDLLCNIACSVGNKEMKDKAIKDIEDELNSRNVISPLVVMSEVRCGEL